MAERINKIRQLLKEKKIDAILVSSYYNVFYLTGLDCFIPIERDAYLLITKGQNYILTFEMYREPVIKNLKNFQVKIISREKTLKDTLKEIYLLEKIKTLGLEEDNLKVYEYKIFKRGVKTIHVDLLDLRKIKEEGEIKEITEACRLGDEAFKYILKQLKEGVTEIEIARGIDAFIRRKADISFDTIVAFGSNCSIPHHRPSRRKLKKGEFVLIDFGARVNNYCSDMTRTLVFGKASGEQKRVYSAVSKAQEAAANYISSHKSVQGAKPDEISRKVLSERGFSDYPHTLGHGIGLEVHEHRVLAPNSKEEIKEGMVFSIEPGVYKDGFGGVRIEDLYLFRNGKLTQLTQSPKQLIEVFF